MIKSFFYPCLLLLTLVSCGPRGKHFKIEGKFKDLQLGEVYIYNQSDEQARFDTLRIKNGTFVYEGTAEEPTPYVLVFQNAMEQVIFVDGGKTLEYSASSNDMGNYVVNGSDENKLLNEFREETSKMTAVKIKAAARSFIENHPESPVSVYMLDKYFVQDGATTHDELLQLVKSMRKHLKNNIYLINLQTTINTLKNGEVGKKLPAIELTTKMNKTINLSKLTKPYTLVAFWSTWMDEEWELLSALREFSRTYGSNLGLVAVSLDTQIYKWEEMIRMDSLTIDNVCDGKAWDSQPVLKMGVREVPFYLLADKSGKIVAQGTKVDDMKRDVAKYAKKDQQQKENTEGMPVPSV